MRRRERGVVLVLSSVMVFLLITAYMVEGAEIKLLNPDKGVSLPKGEVTFIGKVCGAQSGKATVIINGKKDKLRLDRGVFYKQVSLKPGKYSLQVLFPGAKPYNVTFQAGGKSGYKYHISDMDCFDCHGKGFTVERPEDRICYRCHDRKDGGKLVHGPLGSGSCAICHDPHGSSLKHFLRDKTTSLCTACHDQSSSSGHVAKARKKGCQSCHNPHSSNKEFFLR